MKKLLLFALIFSILFSFPATVRATEETLPTTTVDGVVCVLGDMNDDGVLRTGDARLILMAAADLYEPSLAHTVAGDINHDGFVRSDDARIALRICADLESAENYAFPDNLPDYTKKEQSNAHFCDYLTSVNIAPGGSTKFYVDVENCENSEIELYFDEKADGFSAFAEAVEGGYAVTVTADSFVSARSRKTTTIIDGIDKDVRLCFAWLTVKITSEENVLLCEKIRVYVDYPDELNVAALCTSYCESFFDCLGDDENYFVYISFSDSEKTKFYALPFDVVFTVTTGDKSVSFENTVAATAEFAEFDWNGEMRYSVRTEIPKSSILSDDGNAEVLVTVKTPWMAFNSYSYPISGLL